MDAVGYKYDFDWSMGMDFNEKKLYHQIHPLKLLTDWITGVFSLYLLWLHHLLTAMMFMFVPSIVISIIIIKYSNLVKIKRSSFGNYILRSMTKKMEIIRFVGFAVMTLGAWLHLIGLMGCGLMIILIGWFRGMAHGGSSDNGAGGIEQRK